MRHMHFSRQSLLSAAWPAPTVFLAWGSQETRGCGGANNHSGPVSSYAEAPGGWRHKFLSSRWAKIDALQLLRRPEDHVQQRDLVSAAVIVARSLLLPNYLSPRVNKHAASARHTMRLRIRRGHGRPRPVYGVWQAYLRFPIGFKWCFQCCMASVKCHLHAFI